MSAAIQQLCVLDMDSLGKSFKALVIGSTGTIGAAFVQALQADPHCSDVFTLSRSSHPLFELESETGIAQAAASLGEAGPFDLIIDATGALTIDGQGPEKHIGALNAERLARSFEVNAIGPALLLKHFTPSLNTQRSIFAKLSARVGSIADNQKGGWYGYRASKAALNMILQTAAIELHRKRPEAIIAAMQPGTVASPLSQAFVAGHHTITPTDSAVGLLDALDRLTPRPGAHFIDFKGNEIPW